jgi:ribosomal protein L21E
MPTFEPGDRVRVDITDTTDPDFDWHGEHGEVVDVLKDDAGEVTGDDRDSLLYRIELDEFDRTLDLRHRDFRAPFDE